MPNSRIQWKYCKVTFSTTNKPARESLLKNRLAQPLGPLQVGVDHCFEPLGHSEPPLHLGHDAVLFGQGREGDSSVGDRRYSDVALTGITGFVLKKAVLEIE